MIFEFSLITPISPQFFEKISQKYHLPTIDTSQMGELQLVCVKQWQRKLEIYLISDECNIPLNINYRYMGMANDFIDEVRQGTESTGGG